jgi:required for meiotic nuclear division protein 1
MTATTDTPMPGTIVTPVRIENARIDVRAEYFESPIDLDALRARYRPPDVLDLDPLVLRLPGDAHAVVLPFGAVVFWQCPEALCAGVLDDVRQLPGMGQPVAAVRDEVLVLGDQPEDRAGFRELRLRHLSLEHVKLISGALGQSVALRHSELEVSRALRNAAPIVHALETRGALLSSGHSVVRTVGFALSVRGAILAKLSLFDDPAETWRSERLARLHGLLHDHFDIRKRLAAVQEKVTYLADLNETLMDLLQTRTGHRLEWIVILLIVIEVMFSVVHFVNGS